MLPHLGGGQRWAAELESAVRLPVRGAPSASEDWAMAGEHLHQAGEHLDVVHDDVTDSWYKSGITHAGPIE
jgi:hypothetical protein